MSLRLLYNKQEHYSMSDYYTVYYCLTEKFLGAILDNIIKDTNQSSQQNEQLCFLNKVSRAQGVENNSDRIKTLKPIPTLARSYQSGNICAVIQRYKAYDLDLSSTIPQRNTRRICGQSSRVLDTLLSPPYSTRETVS